MSKIYKNMAQQPKLAPGEYYHLYNRGTDKRKIFLNKHDYMRFLMLLYLCNSDESVNIRDFFKNRNKTLGEIFAIERGALPISIGAFCLMSNHFHLLVRQERDNGISQFMQKLGTAYTMYFNKRNNRTGSLFQGTFKTRHAQNDTYLKYLFAYIHLNPAKIIEPRWKEVGVKNLKKLEEFIKNYEYSSYSEYIGQDRPIKAIVKKDAFPEYFLLRGEFELLIEDWLTHKDKDTVDKG